MEDIEELYRNADAKDATKIRDQLVVRIEIILPYIETPFLKYQNQNLTGFLQNDSWKTFAAIDISAKKLLEGADSDTKKGWSKTWENLFTELIEQKDPSRERFYRSVNKLFRNTGFNVDALVKSNSHGKFWRCSAWRMKLVLHTIQHHPAVNNELSCLGYRFFAPFNPPQESYSDDADPHRIDQGSLVSECCLRSLENAGFCAYNVRGCPTWTGKEASKEQRCLVAHLSYFWHTSQLPLGSHLRIPRVVVLGLTEDDGLGECVMQNFACAVREGSLWVSCVFLQTRSCNTNMCKFILDTHI